jgi:hypothetical protein
LRIHPNLGKKENLQVNWIYVNLLKFSNLTIIAADSEISTYKLMFNCDKVLTFGSSTGIEATYWGKPAIQSGMSLWYYLDAVYTPSNHQELINQLLQKDLIPKPKINALKFGYYVGNRGISFEKYEATGIQDGKYRGVDIKKASSSLKTRTFLWLSNQRFFWRFFKRIKNYKKNKSVVPKYLR